MYNFPTKEFHSKDESSYIYGCGGMDWSLVWNNVCVGKYTTREKAREEIRKLKFQAMEKYFSYD